MMHARQHFMANSATISITIASFATHPGLRIDRK
jgi:hypothetical protein